MAMSSDSHSLAPTPAVNVSNTEATAGSSSHATKSTISGKLPVGSSIGIALDVPGHLENSRSPLNQHLSTPSYQSPLRHHRRGPSQHREIKETLNAHSEYTNNEEDGHAEHHINQYIIKDEIGRGSFGCVYLAIDQYGQEYAVKEFSKSRLRKRAQSNILRRPRQVRRPGHLAAAGGFNSPLHRHSASDLHDAEEQGNPLYLIKEEIAIMKKLNHPNLVDLIEVLDDPEEDSLYMVLEMCKKGVVMKVGLGENADPYDLERCRCWFRDMILGIEYLHAQGVVHRDIKPDNLLLTEDDVLKIVDFGVSEMFEKASDMMTAKSAGSPAFLPPELCISKHGDISGRAADIWSMGVSLYCLRFGRIPFERSSVLELYEAISREPLKLEGCDDPQFQNLLHQMLEKDPSKRITMEELREHPWVNKMGADPLLSKDENIADWVEPPSKVEVNHAITTKMRDLLMMVKAVNKFKGLVDKKRSKRSTGVPERLGRHNPKESIHHKSRTNESTVEHHRLEEEHAEALQQGSRTSSKSQEHEGERGHAHNPLSEEPLFLGIGPGDIDGAGPSPGAQDFIAESPTAAEFSIYDTAYQQEVERIREAQGHTATVYLTRRVDTKLEYRADEHMVEAPPSSEAHGTHQGFRGLLDKAREKDVKSEAKDSASGSRGTRRFADTAAQAVESTKALKTQLGQKGSAVVGSLLGRADREEEESRLGAMVEADVKRQKEEAKY